MKSLIKIQHTLHWRVAADKLCITEAKASSTLVYTSEACNDTFKYVDINDMRSSTKQTVKDRVDPYGNMVNSTPH